MNFGISKETYEGAVEQFERLHLPGETPPPFIPSDGGVEEDEACPLCGAPEGSCDAEDERDCPYAEDDFDHEAWAAEMRGRMQRPPL